MVLTDRYDNRLGTTSQAARDAYIAGVDHVLAATFGARQAFETAIAADPGFALAHAGLARAAMYEADMAGARAAIAQAKSLCNASDTRESQHIGILSLMLAGEAEAARDAVRVHIRDYPRDALVAQVCTNVFGLIGFSGHAGREAELLAYTSGLMPHYGDDWWMMSMHALSLCETGQQVPALALMERSLAINPDNANASHFKSHAQYEAGDTIQGLRFLSDWMEGYDRRAVLHGHLSWHVALWSLHAGDQARMWEIIDASVAPGGAQGLPINVLTDTASIYHRAELAGLEVAPRRWSALSDYAETFFAQPGQSFADVHGALAHAMAGQGDRLARYLGDVPGFAGDLVAPVARAWSAIVRQDWRGALEALTPVMADHARLGGSRAQRDLLEFTWVNILLKLGQTQEAQRALRTRRPLLAAEAPIAG